MNVPDEQHQGLTPEEQARLDELTADFSAASELYAEADLAAGRALKLIREERLFRGADGTQTWIGWLRKTTPVLTGRSPLRVTAARRLIDFFNFRCAVTDAAAWGRCPLPPTQEHTQILLRLPETDLAVKVWITACEAMPDGGVPSVAMVRHAMRLVLAATGTSEVDREPDPDEEEEDDQL